MIENAISTAPRTKDMFIDSEKKNIPRTPANTTLVVDINDPSMALTYL